MKNSLPKRFMNNIEERPEHLSVRSGRNTEKYDDLAQTLKVMESSRAVVLDEHEIEALFGKCYRTTVATQMKKRGIKRTLMALKDGKIHIWTNKI